MPGVRLVGNVTIGIVLLYGGWRVMQGEMTVGVLTAFLLYLRMFFEPMQEISQFYNTFQSASAALEKLYRDRSMQVHPDRAAKGDAKARRIALEYFGSDQVLGQLCQEADL